MNPVPYRDVLDLFDAQKATNGYQSLPEYAASLNELTGTQAFDAGLHPSWIKNASVGIDRAIESTGAPDVLGNFFGELGDTIGMRDAGESAGRALPRGLANFLPMIAAAPFTGGGSVLGPLALAASSALSGAEAYTETGSPTAGLITAGALPLAGLATKIGGQLALRAIGAPLLEGAVKPTAQIVAEGLLPRFTPEIQGVLADSAGKRVAETGVQRVVDYLGGQVAALGTFEAANEVSSVIQGHGLYNPVSPEKLFSTLIGQLPFAALDIPRVAKSTPNVESMKRFLATEAKNVDAQSSLDSIPVKTEVQGTMVDPVKLVQKMAENMKEKAKVEGDTTLTDAEKESKLAELLGETDKLAKEVAISKKGTEPFTGWVEGVIKTALETKVEQADPLGLTAMGQGVGKGITDSLYTSLFTKLQQGDTTELGKPSSVLIQAKPLFDAGKIKTPEDLRVWVNTEWKAESLKVKATEAQTKAEEVVNIEPPKTTSDALTQIQNLTTTSVESGLPPVTVEGLHASMERVESISTDSNDVVQKTLQVEKAKVSRAESLQAANLASQAAKEQRYVVRLTELGRREDLSRSSHPDAKRYGEDLMEINKFLKANPEQVGEGKAEGTSLSRAAVNAYFNWEEAGRPDGYAGLQSRMGKAKQTQRREATVSRPTLKEDGALDSDANKSTKRFASVDEANKFANENNIIATAQPRKGGKWFVLEATAKAAKITSLENELGGIKANVERSAFEGVINTNEVADFFAAQSDEGSPTLGERTSIVGVDEASPLIDVVNDEGSGDLRTQSMTDLISVVSTLPDEVVHAEFMHKFEGDPEEHVRDIEIVRLRLAAILELQRKYGNKAVNNKDLSLINPFMPTYARFATHADLLEFNRDQGTQRLLLEATREMIRAGKGNILPHGSGWESVGAGVGSTENGSFKGLGELTPSQQTLADQYKLTGASALEPLQQVAQLDQGTFGSIANALIAQFGDRIGKVQLANMRVEDGRAYVGAEFNPNHGKKGTILYGRQLLPSEVVRPSDIEYMHQVIVHETLHALTHELLRDSKNNVERANLDTLRQKAIQLLPKEIREVFEKSQAENRYDKYVLDRNMRLYDLTPEQYSWHGVLYGLENVDEFISQSFGSSQMQEFLRTQKSSRKGNLFKTFADFVKNLLGLGTQDATLFMDVVSATDRLLNPKLRKPLERESVLSGFMGQLGLGPKQVVERTQGVGGILDLMSHMLPNKQLQKDYRNLITGTIAENFTTAHEKGLLSPEDTATLNRAQSYFDNLSDGERQIVTGLFERSQPIDTLADVLHATSRSLIDEKLRMQLQSHMMFMDKPILDAISALRRYTTTVTSGTLHVLNAAARGLVDDITNSPGTAHINALYEGTQKLLKTEKELRRNEDRFSELRKMEPVGFRVAQVSSDGTSPMPALFKNENIRTIAEEMGIVKPSILSRTFEPLAQLAEKYPVMRDALYRVFKHQGDTREAIRTSLLPFAGEFGPNGEFTVSKQRLQKAYEVAQSPVMNKAVSDIRRLMNERKENFDPTTPEFSKVLDGLGPEQRPRVIEFVNQMSKSMKLVQDTIVARQGELGTVTLAQLIQTRQPELRSNQSMTLAKTMVEAVRLLDDPTQAPIAQQTLQGVQARMSPEVFQEVAQFAVGDKQRLQDLQGFYAKRPWFSTEQRFRRFLLRMTRPDSTDPTKVETYTPDFLNERQASQARKRLEAEGWKYADLVDRQGNDNHPSFSSDAMIDKVAEINRTRMAQISQVLRDQPQVLESINRYLNIEGDLQRAQTASQLMSKGSQRRLEGGREELDMIANHVTYLNRVINGQTSRVTRASLEHALMDPELSKQPELQRLAQQGIENYLRPDTQAGQALTQANFLYYMGMNISTGFMELGQSAFSLIPTMVREGVAVPNAYQSIIQTAQNITKWAVTGKWSNAEHEAVMSRASARGEIGLGVLGEAMDDNAHASIGLSQLATNQDMSALGKLVRKPLAMYETVATGLYGKFTKFNARMALLTAFDHFRSKGLGFEEAFAEAERINNVANFAGGRAARSIGLYSLEGQAGRTASMALGSLQSYTMGMISMMGRYFMEGFGGHGNLRPSERSQAKKAALIMFGTQLAAAGALGLPGVGAGIALLEQMFPNLELNKAIRENLAKLGGDDKELGAFISDTALRGIPNQIGGVDVGSRLSLGNNVMGLSSYDGFDPVNILGPSFNLFKNMAVGVTQAAQGQVGQAAQTVLPPAYKKIMQLSSGEGAIRDNAGKLLMQPSMGETFAMMVGFQPKRLSDIKDAKRIESRSQEIERRETIQFNSHLADLLQANDQQGLRGALQARLQEDTSFDPRAAIRQAASLVEQRTMPLDLSRTSTSTTAGSLLQTYQGGSASPTELQRLQLRKSIEASTGIPGIGRVTARDMQTAQLVDQLMAKGLTRDQAKAQVDKMMSPSTSPLPF